MKFLANENFPLTSVKELRNKGYNTTSICESKETRGIKDNEVLFMANHEERIILTFDRDYGELIYRLKMIAPYGVVYFRFQPLSPLEPYDFLIKIIETNKIKLEQMFTIVERDKIRQRHLP